MVYNGNVISFIWRVKGRIMIIRLGEEKDIDEIEKLYNELNDYLEKNINYPVWKKGVYPIREDAIKGIKENSLYVVIIDDKIVGSVILSHEPEKAYLNAKWKRDLSYENIIVLYTFVGHPKYFGRGIGKALIEFAEKYGVETNVNSLRLDVYEKNTPAIHLYEKCGFNYIDKVDLGLGEYGLKWFALYEKLI